MSQHIIFGAGLVGGFLGGVLRARGEDVGLVVRPQLRNRYDQGLKLTDVNGNECHADGFRLLDPEDTSDSLGADVLWLTVKCTGVEAALADLGPYLSDRTTIICCQNGLGSDHLVKRAYPNNKVVRAMVQFNVATIADNHLHRSTDGELALESCPVTASLAESIGSGILPIALYDDMETVLWAKLQLNLTNAVNGLADVPTKTMLEQRAYRKVIALLMGELLAVTRAQGMVLPKLTGLPAESLPRFMGLPDWLFKLLGKRMLNIDPSAQSSLWWDLKHDKTTEVEHLNGAVVDAGNALGIACPYNRVVVDLVHEVERGQSEQGMSGKYLLRQLQGS